MNIKKTAGLTIFPVVMLIVGAVDNIRNLPATALFGTSLIFFFIFSAIVFLIPAALVSAELASTWPQKSGVFHWTRLAWGDKTAFIAIWLQWISNLVWFPTILSFIASTATYFLSPSIAQNKFYLISMILGSFWFITLINLRGIHVSARYTSFCAIFGMVLPMGLIMLLAAIWVMLGKPLQIHFTARNLIPQFSDSQNWISLTAIMTAFLGIELAAVHIKEIANPQQAFPKALLYSVILILTTMILGSLAIAIVLPKNQINLINGVMQAFTNFFAAYHISWIVPAITVLLLVGTSGSVISWVISPAKGLLQAAQFGFLPEIFSKENKHGVATNLLIGQAVIVSLVCAAFLLMPSVNGSYWLLTALNTQLYILMYVIMFITGLITRYKFPDQVKGFTIPGGKLGLWVTCLLGLCGCVTTLIVGFVPPDGINVGSVLHYEFVFGSGIAAMLLPIAFCIAYRNRNKKTNFALETT